MKDAVSILLVEDDPGHARLIEKNMRRAGVTNAIHHVTDGSSAIAFLSHKPPRHGAPLLILLDLNLPDMTGLDVLKHLKADPDLRQFPVFVLTTTDDQLEIQRCYELGCSVYMTKPLVHQKFADAIRHLGQFFSVMQFPEPIEA